MRSLDVRFPRATVAVAALGLAVSSAALAVIAHPVAAGAAPHLVPSSNVAVFATKTSTIAVQGRGNGHGHGMSQYGAQGAAIAGLSAGAIAQFYYPHATLTTIEPSNVRVLLSGADWPEVAAQDTLAVAGYGTLPTGYLRYRLTNSSSGSGLRLGAQRPSGTWTPLALNLASPADFSSSRTHIVRLFNSDGTSTEYWGSVGAVRSGSDLLTINRVSLDNYTAGVVPREMPASWRSAAVAAQAIAARTYARYEVNNHTGSAYDICDTSYCQVYGGHRHFSSSGAVLWTDDRPAILGNQNQVMRYHSNAIFAQFSASNGGSVLSGGLPYLVDQADSYDNASSGDPYLGWSDSVSATAVASYYGLRTVTSIQVTKRNGYGTWGGWVLSATVNGTSSSGATAHVSTTGTTLAWAMGVRDAYFAFSG